MKRWALAVALVLPLPFAALPLVAVALQTPHGSEHRPFAFETTPIDQPTALGAASEPLSLGFLVRPDLPVECTQDIGF